jgi:hypothetical protein
MYQLSYIKYCQFIILTFTVDLLWAMGLWVIGVMPDNDIFPPLPRLVGFTKAGTRKWGKGLDVRRNWFRT